jgi:hypothetical protein
MHLSPEPTLNPLAAVADLSDRLLHRCPGPFAPYIVTDIEFPRLGFIRIVGFVLRLVLMRQLGRVLINPVV